MTRYIDADAISAELRDMAKDEYFSMAGAAYSVIFERVADVFDKMPTAQPEQKWIPCSERLPEIDMSHPHHDNYLVQYDSGNMDVASWSNVNRFWADHVTDPHWACAQFAEVVAWMPLPEPYKEMEE